MAGHQDEHHFLYTKNSARPRSDFIDFTYPSNFFSPAARSSKGDDAAENNDFQSGKVGLQGYTNFFRLRRAISIRIS